MINELFHNAHWFKSSLSPDANECVEVAFVNDYVGVRDSKDPGGAALVFPGEQWDRFLSSGVWRG
ncbi:DUF397 domain-containing protein [Nocardia sp. NPDC056000]|uniref:DUF397 domain-containing protein n=1 Tax=Nocardia sp. NPDC056000 TaxID=3345674 RepID=UPI0035D730DB